MAFVHQNGAFRRLRQSSVLHRRGRDNAQEAHLACDCIGSHRADHSTDLQSTHCGQIELRIPSSRPEYCQLFTGMSQELYMPQNSHSTRTMSFSGGWLSLLPAFTGRRKLLDDSILALYCGFIGCQKEKILLWFTMEWSSMARCCRQWAEIAACQQKVIWKISNPCWPRLSYLPAMRCFLRTVVKDTLSISAVDYTFCVNQYISSRKPGSRRYLSKSFATLE